MQLDEQTCANATPNDKTQKLSDGGGLQLWVMPNGSKYWRFSYRFGTKQKTLAIGIYPECSLEEARQARADAKQLLQDGRDPVQAKKQKKAELKAAQSSFQTIAEEYLAKLEREGRAVNTMKKLNWLLSLAYKDLGPYKIGDIRPVDVLTCLQKVEARGKYETARRLRSTIGSVFRYAIATARAENDPTVALQGALTTPKVKPRAAILDPKELGDLLRVIDGYEGWPTVRAGLQLIAMLFPRPGEIRTAEWKDFDFKKRVWSIPAERMKMRRPHKVPLPPQAIEILDGLRPYSGDSPIVFPSPRGVNRPISDNAMTAALRNMGYSKEEVCPHGFRASASTLLNESGLWHPDAIERQLAHVDSNDVRRAYARSEFWDERVKMMNWWADYLDEIRLMK